MPEPKILNTLKSECLCKLKAVDMLNDPYVGVWVDLDILMYTDLIDILRKSGYKLPLIRPDNIEEFVYGYFFKYLDYVGFAMSEYVKYDQWYSSKTGVYIKDFVRWAKIPGVKQYIEYMAVLGNLKMFTKMTSIIEYSYREPPEMTTDQLLHSTCIFRELVVSKRLNISEAREYLVGKGSVQRFNQSILEHARIPGLIGWVNIFGGYISIDIDSIEYRFEK